MASYWAELKYKVKNCAEPLIKHCTVSDKKYSDPCIPIRHSDNIFYVRASEFNTTDVNIIWWNIKDNFEY